MRYGGTFRICCVGSTGTKGQDSNTPGRRQGLLRVVRQGQRCAAPKFQVGLAGDAGLVAVKGVNNEVRKVVVCRGSEQGQQRA